MSFWDKLPRPFTVLAPMEDVTDIVFRHVVARAGRPDVFMTEFTNAASFCSPKGNFSTRGRLMHDDTEQPIVAQVWGTVPEHFNRMAKALAGQGFAGIDINMGCPAKDVYKIGAGSGLINNPDLAIKLIAAAKEGGLPVSVKTRLGVSRISEMETWLPTLLMQNLANLTIHLRTRKEMSKVPAHYELIPEIVAMRDRLAPETTLTINGDVRDYQHIMKLHAQYPGVDGFMIGRGVFANPFCFKKVKIGQPSSLSTTPPSGDYVAGLPAPTGAGRSQSDLFSLFRYHLDQYDKYRQIMPDERPELVRNYDSLKHFFKIYVKDFPGAAELRAKLYDCKSTDEVRRALDKFARAR